MKFLIILLTILLLPTTPGLKIDFSQQSQVEDWVIINDGVMGGKSESSVSLNPDKIVFSGVISLENNGGFASLRSPVENHDLSNYSKAKIKFRSYGRTFSLMLESSLIFYEPVFKYDIQSKNEEWAEIEIDLSDFKEYRLSQFTGNNAHPGALEDILRIGIILFDKKDGPFKLEIEYLEFT
jgi:hypothetical protein